MLQMLQHIVRLIVYIYPFQGNGNQFRPGSKQRFFHDGQGRKLAGSGKQARGE
jgi:hypothetical protein